MRPPTRTITRRVPGAAEPATIPYEISYGRRLLDRGRRRRSGDHGGTVAFSDVPILAHSTSMRSSPPSRSSRIRRCVRKPLVVGGNPQGRGVVATANYVARRFGIRSAMSSAEALRRCPERRVHPAPARALSPVLAGRLGRDPRGRAAGRAGRDRRGLPRPRHGRPSFTGARAVAEAVQTSVRAATSLSCSLGVSTSKVVCKVASDRRKPGGITVVPPGTEARFLAPVPGARAPGCRPQGRGSASRRPASRRWAISPLSPMPSSASCCPGRSARSCATARCGIDPRDLELETERVSISVEETFERDISDRAVLHAEIEPDGRRACPQGSCDGSSRRAR